MDGHMTLLEEHKEKLIKRIHQHPFLHRCRQRAVTLDELKILLVQQGIYSGYFTRYLCALMANLPNQGHVLSLARNLCEELGLMEHSAIPHSAIYRTMLDHFGLTLDGARPFLGTRRLIDTMFDHCRDPKVARGLGALCLGAEALVPAIYADLITAFEGCGADRTSVHFFHLHVECDDGHAETMWNIMLGLAKQDPDQFPLMLSAGTAMVDARLDFFSSIASSHKVTTQANAADASLELIEV